MSLDTTTMNTLANEARKTELKQAIASAQGQVSALSSMATLISTSASDYQTILTTKQAALAALEAGNGAGITDSFGYKTAFLTAFITEAAAQGGVLTQDVITALCVLAGVDQITVTT